MLSQLGLKRACEIMEMATAHKKLYIFFGNWMNEYQALRVREKVEYP